MRSYTVIGAGAVGLLYGTRLAAAGHPVRWVLRSGVDTVRSTGIGLRSVDGDVEIAAADLEVYDTAGDVPASDTVIVALKTTANPHLADLVAPAVAHGSTVAVFQNGLGVEDQVRAAVPQAGTIIGAMCFVCAHRVGPGRCDHLDYGAVTAGQLDGPAGPDVHGLVEDLVGAGIEARAVDDLRVYRWRKLVWNIPFNGLSVLLDASTDAILGDPETRVLVADLMDEVVAAARADGHPIDPAFRDEMLRTTDAMTPYAPSMKLDHEARRPMELDAIYGEPLRVATAVGAPMTRVQVLARQLRFLDGHR